MFEREETGVVKRGSRTRKKKGLWGYLMCLNDVSFMEYDLHDLNSGAKIISYLLHLSVFH